MITDDCRIASWLILLPLAGFLWQALLGPIIMRYLGWERGRKITSWMGVIPIAGAFAVALRLWLTLENAPPAARQAVIPYYDWIHLAGINIPFELMIDPLSVTMALLITGVGGLIHLYSTGYMAEDRDLARFFAYMNLFVASMTLLVMAGNLAVMFIGWEGVGLCSYLLIGFWYEDQNNATAGNKAFIVNRIGDWGLLIGMFLFVAVLTNSPGRFMQPDQRWLSFDELIPQAALTLTSHPWLTAGAALFLFLGAVGKSAQFPLYLWLPDAMAGPTPVSALIHAATMVTAGVFLLNRMSFLYAMSPVASAVVAAVGAFTALFAAVVALGQTDIKRVLAYSTVSQLGFMFIGCGAGAYWAGMYHVLTHGFFKALLFLGAGAVMHAMAQEQDMRRYGNLRKYMPITTWTMVIAFLTISGIPGLSGFFSKEALLGAGAGSGHALWGGIDLGWWASIVGLVAAGLTALYMTRLTLLTFFGNEERWRTLPATAEPQTAAHPPGALMLADADDPDGFFFTHEELIARANQDHAGHDERLTPDHTPHEAPPSMTVPLIILAALAAFSWVFLNGRISDWLRTQARIPVHEVQWVTPVAIMFALLGIIAGFFMYGKALPQSEGYDLSKWARWRIWAGAQFGYDKAMVSVTEQGGRQFAYAIWKGIDELLIDGIVTLLAGIANVFGLLLRWTQTGYTRLYVAVMLTGALAIVAYLMTHAGGFK